MSANEQTYWNGLPTEATRGTAIVADSPDFPRYWAKEEGLIGERIPVVRVVLDGVNYGGGIDYLDDRDGSGWRKVTEGRGGPRYGHASVSIEPDSFEPEGQIPAQHTLTYPGHQKPDKGQLMGPGLDGSVWKVIDSMYDSTTDLTTVTCEEVIG